MKLDTSFYIRENVVQISKELLGKVVFTNINNTITAGIIVETEAYCGATDKACHAYQKKTKRTAVMYQEGGKAYVYLCYGIHHLFNIVTNVEGKADAVLIRAIEPILGIEMMKKRRNIKNDNYKLTAGPGVAAQALGINISFNSVSLANDTIWLENQGIEYNDNDIDIRKRVGVEYAKDDALLPWRFSVKNNYWVSKAK